MNKMLKPCNLPFQSILEHLLFFIIKHPFRPKFKYIFLFHTSFYSLLGIRQGNVAMPDTVADEIEILLSITKKDGRQNLVKLNIFKSTTLEKLHSRVL